MRQAMAYRWWILVVAVFALAMLADPAWAQETAARDAQKKSMFKMFFTSSDHIGQIMIIGLVIMSVMVVSLCIDAWMKNRTKALIPPLDLAEYQRLAEEKQYPELIAKAAADKSLFGKVLNSSLAQAPQGYAAMERAVEEYADVYGTERIRKLEYLNIFGAIGPMVGLFGTVYGMIVAFEAMVSAGGQPKPAELAAGVSTALVNTFWGLVVAIPAIVAAALARSHIEGTVVTIMIHCEELIARFRPAKAAAPAQKPAAAAAKPGVPTAAPVAKPQPKPAAAVV